MQPLRGKKLYRVSLAAAGVALCTYGWDAGVIGGILETPEFQSAMHFPNTNTVTMIASVYTLGSWLGCLIVPFLGMSRGRKQSMIVGNIIMLIGAIIAACSFGPGQLIAGRVIVGIGNGFLTSIAPIFVAETAVKSDIRGRGVILMICFGVFGIASAYWVDFGMVFVPDSARGSQAVWRFPVAFQGLFSLVSLVIILCFISDTPRWYYAKGRMEDGDDVLSRLFDKPITDPIVAQSKQDILISLEIERAETANLRFRDFIWDRSDLKVARRISLACLVFSLEYLQGIDMIAYYTTTIFQSYIGLPPITSSALSGLANSLMLIGTGISWLLCERWGRRTWLLAATVLQVIFMTVFTGCLSHQSKASGAAAAAFLLGYFLVYGAGWVTFAFVYASEIVPLRYRHIGFAIGNSFQWLLGFVTLYAGPIGAANVGYKIWFWFLSFNIISVPIVYFWFPETRGLSLEEIDLVFMSPEVRERESAKKLGHQSSRIYTEDEKNSNNSDVEIRGKGE